MKNKANIQFIDFKVPESHFAFKAKGNYEINLAFNVKGEVISAKSLFVLKLGIKVQDKNELFFIDAHTESTFSYDKTVDLNEYLEGLFILNAPAIVFPYLRAYITNITTQSGMTPIILPTLNLTNLGESLKQNINILE